MEIKKRKFVDKKINKKSKKIKTETSENKSIFNCNISENFYFNNKDIISLFTRYIIDKKTIFNLRLINSSWCSLINNDGIRINFELYFDIFNYFKMKCFWINRKNNVYNSISKVSFGNSFSFLEKKQQKELFQNLGEDNNIKHIYFKNSIILYNYHIKNFPINIESIKGLNRIFDGSYLKDYNKNFLKIYKNLKNYEFYCSNINNINFIKIIPKNLDQLTIIIKNTEKEVDLTSLIIEVLNNCNPKNLIISNYSSIYTHFNIIQIILKSNKYEKSIKKYEKNPIIVIFKDDKQKIDFLILENFFMIFNSYDINNFNYGNIYQNSNIKINNKFCKEIDNNILLFRELYFKEYDNCDELIKNLELLCLKNTYCYNSLNSLFSLIFKFNSYFNLDLFSFETISSFLNNQPIKNNDRNIIIKAIKDKNYKIVISFCNCLFTIENSNLKDLNKEKIKLLINITKSLLISENNNPRLLKYYKPSLLLNPYVNIKKSIENAVEFENFYRNLIIHNKIFLKLTTNEPKFIYNCLLFNEDIFIQCLRNNLINKLINYKVWSMFALQKFAKNKKYKSYYTIIASSYKYKFLTSENSYAILALIKIIRNLKNFCKNIVIENLYFPHNSNYFNEFLILIEIINLHVTLVEDPFLLKRKKNLIDDHNFYIKCRKDLSYLTKFFNNIIKTDFINYTENCKLISIIKNFLIIFQ